MLSPSVVNLFYLVAAVLFILGLKGLTHPRTAVRGNLFGSIGMLVAVVVTLLQGEFAWGWIVAGLLVGIGIGVVFALKITMEAMPQLVALFNGFGGGASLLVASAYLWNELGLEKTAETGIPTEPLLATALSGLIGGVTLTGSLIAFAKLQGIKRVESWKFEGQPVLNAGLAVFCVVTIMLMVTLSDQAGLMFFLLAVASLALGVFLVTGIGGADMPVVIALLNSYSGLAASATGFIYGNTALIISGSLVGASGLILTQIMCKAMNRSLANVLFGTIATGGTVADADEMYANVKRTSAEELAILLDGAGRVVIVPGYGMAVAQAQHAVRDLTNLLIERGTEVEFGIHPVAGRMPGHMNVLLAEVDIPYEQLREMSDINPTLDQADVVIVLGANDVVNPSARTDPDSPIHGMPIIDVDKARTVVVIKRSLSPGFAGIPNPLFAADNTLMLFGDGREAVQEIIAAIKES